MKTFSAKPHKIENKWFLVDAKDKIVGRLATEIVRYLKGKHKVEYTPHIDTGDYIIVINASKVIVTGDKKRNKTYYHHTGYIGGIKSITFNRLIASHPERVIGKAVKGMLPNNSLGRSIYKKMKVYPGSTHPHVAQDPQVLDIKFRIT